MSDTRIVRVSGFGPHIRLKGTGSVKLVTNDKIVTVPLQGSTVIRFDRPRPTDLKPAA